MDGDRLDVVSRTLASGPSRALAGGASRRGVLGGLGVLLASRPLRQATPVAAADEGWIEDEAFGGFCRVPGFPCGSDDQCCANTCLADGTCGCRKRGRISFSKRVCCSGRKKRGDKSRCR
jgi:hypothetical protein